MDEIQRKKMRSALYGLLVGDALGVPYEFHPPEAIPAYEAIEMRPPEGFRRAHGGLPPGTWSDDGAQALALLASLNAHGKLDVEDFGRRLLRWFREGYMAVDNHVFDVGIGTASALHRIESGVSPSGAGGVGEMENGNGSLMRVLPLAVWHRGSDAELIRDAMAQSLPTHGHVRSQLCCALYCVWVRRILEEVDAPWDEAVAVVGERVADDPALERELEEEIRPLEAYDCRGTGYVVDCLHSAVRLNRENGTYIDVVREAIALGNDTDTTACVAGGVAALQFGLDSIPVRWREELRGKAMVEGLLDELS